MWQPIATAPEDRPIIAVNKADVVRTLAVIEWRVYEHAWGGWEFVDPWQRDGYSEPDPTHWMDIPPLET